MMSGPPYHIKAGKGDIAENVIAMGDPGRVELLAQLLDKQRVVNKHRGLLTITGEYHGTPVTLATHGIGCASSMIVFEELGMLGAKRIVRLGSAGGLNPTLKIGDVVVASAALYSYGGCGLNQYLPNTCGATAPHPYLTTWIMEELRERNIEYRLGPVYSSDAFYAEDPEWARRWGEKGVLAVEMEAAGLFTLGWIRGWETATVLVISDNLVSGKEYMATTVELSDKYLAVGEAVLTVFTKHYA